MASVSILEVTNPGWAATNAEFRDMAAELVEETGLPSINADSMLNYLCTIVQNTYCARLRGEAEALNLNRLYVGFVGGKIAGMTLFRLMPNRMPHIQTIEWTFCKSRDIRLTHLFCRELLHWKRKWNAVHIMCMVPPGEKAAKLFNRFFKKARITHEYGFANGMHAGLLKMGAPADGE